MLRDGEGDVIDARELVPGDVIRLEAGDAVPADARLIETAELRMAETKSADAVPPADTPLADRTNMIYQATTVVAGSGTAVVVATGMATELGRIGGPVGGIEEERTPLERRLDALGRRLPSVESLGSVTVVCTDKTGTLTAGEMTVTRFRVHGRDIHVTGIGYSPDGGFEEGGRPLDAAEDPVLGRALRVAALANRAGLVREDSRWTVRGDPTDAALLVAARKAGLERESLRADWPEVGEVPFSSERQYMATFHEAPAYARS